VAGASTLGLLALVASAPDLRRRPLPWVSVGAAALAAAAWLSLPPRRLLEQNLLQLTLPELKILSVHEGVNESLAVSESPTGDRALHIDGFTMSAGNLFAERYMRAFAHVPLLELDAPRRVLVICFGVGNTLHAASLHRSVTSLEVADLSRDVLERAGDFAGTNHRVLTDPRVAVFVNDGRNHLLTRPEHSFDLITLEPPPISQAGISALYSVEFYRAARGRLAPGGYLSQWLPAYQLPGEQALTAVRAFLDVFPNGVLLSGAEQELILLGRNAETNTIDPEQVREHLRARPEVAADLARVGLGSDSAIIAMFAGAPSTLRAATQDVLPVTDDYPSMEYGMDPLLERTRVPAQLFDVGRLAEWCPRCFAGSGSGDALSPDLPDLGPLLGEAARLYRSQTFLERPR
jgi:spermidine synthase